MDNFKFILYINEAYDINQGEVRDYHLIKNVNPMRLSNKAVAEKILDTGRQKLEELALDDSEFVDMYNIAVDDIEDIKKMCCALKSYLDFRKKFLSIETSTDSIFDEIKNHEIKLNVSSESIKDHRDVDKIPSLTILEKALGDEVTLAYYINLLESHNDLLVVGEQLNPDYAKNGSIEIIIENPSIRLDPYSPRQRLKVIISEDNQIRDFVVAYLEDSIKYHRLEFENIKRLSGSIISDTS
jgi:hypothetical protein